MSRKASPVIGFNRRVDLKWLGYTVRLFTGGHDESKIHEELSEYLSSKLSISSSAKRGSREKTITLLLKTWVRVRPEIEPLRDDGLELLESLPKSQHLAVHWGMTMAATHFGERLPRLLVVFCACRELPPLFRSNAASERSMEKRKRPIDQRGMSSARFINGGL